MMEASQRKTSTKGKEKRLKRKEEQQKISQSLAVVEAANKLVDPLEPFPVFRKYSNNNGIECNLYVKRVADLDEGIKRWVFALTKKNMQLRYEQCSWGWSDAKKQEELLDEKAWFLIAQASDQTLFGFSHFRFDLDECVEVLYCYELQLETVIQRKGLGKFMMQILELIAFKNSMKKVILTVLKNNHYSKFFRNLNYEVDESSPIDYGDESYPYEILSKVNRRLASTLPPPQSHKLPHSHGHGHSHNGHCCPGHHH